MYENVKIHLHKGDNIMDELTKEELSQKLLALKKLKRTEWCHAIADGFWCMNGLMFLASSFINDYLSLEIFLFSLQYYIALVSIGSVAIGYVFQRDVNTSIDNYIKSLTENEINQDNTLKLK